VNRRPLTPIEAAASERIAISHDPVLRASRELTRRVMAAGWVLAIVVLACAMFL
jgi:hypothetical protein